jgi:hypothetical protein
MTVKRLMAELSKIDNKLLEIKINYGASHLVPVGVTNVGKNCILTVASESQLMKRRDKL